MRARPAGWLVLVAVLTVQTTSDAYLHLTGRSQGRVVATKWGRSTVAWHVADRGAPGVPATALQSAVARAAATWEAVPTAAIGFEFAGFTAARPLDDDGRTTVGFEDASDLERVLAATSFVVDVDTGEIVEADVFFNTRFAWSTAQAGDPAAFDLESVAVHEIGHVLGLGHSALGETEVLPTGRRVIASGAVMFPISLGRGSTADRTLQADDVGGVSALYPADGFTARTGTLQGRVVRDGRPVPGAHVVAFHPVTGDLVGGFALGDDASFRIAGLAPGAYVLRVEPLDDVDVESFFARSATDLDFRPTFHDRHVIVPAGGASAMVEVAVSAK